MVKLECTVGCSSRVVSSEVGVEVGIVSGEVRVRMRRWRCIGMYEVIVPERNTKYRG